jgi:hypothetical protein
MGTEDRLNVLACYALFLVAACPKHCFLVLLSCYFFSLTKHMINFFLFPFMLSHSVAHHMLITHM